MKFLPLILSLGLLSFLAKPAFAATSSVSINNQVNTGNSVNVSSNTSSNTNISVSESDGETSVEVNNNQFIISGTVKSVSGNVVNISGQNVTYNSISIPSVGSKVTVKGKVENGVFIAESSSSTGTTSNQVLGTTTNIKVNTSTGNNTQNSPSPSASTSASPIAPASVSADITLENKGEISKLLDQLQTILNKIFSLFG